MTISAKIIEDSVNTSGVRLTTLQLMYPRFIHAEFMTHRVFSRNASSSRAIPVTKMIEQVRNNPAMPIHWGTNKPGMQAGEQLTGKTLERAKELWLMAAQYAADCADEMQNKDISLHKQIANRILEPFQHIHVIVTATEWDNFFELRAHADAQPEIQELAVQMKQAMDASEPRLLHHNEWHLPYVTPDERQTLGCNILPKVSAARCARVSYLTHDGQHPEIAKDLALYHKLITSKPSHASPIEHQAKPDTNSSLKHLHGNFKGWLQYRKLVEIGYYQKEA